MWGPLLFGFLLRYLHLRRGERSRTRLDLVGPILLLSLSAWVWLLVYRDLHSEGARGAVHVGPWLVPSRPYAGLFAGAAVVWLATALADLLGWRQVAAVPGLLLGSALALGGGVVVGTVKAPFGVEFVAVPWAGAVAAVVWLTVCGVVFGWNAALLEIPLGVAGLSSLTFLAATVLTTSPPATSIAAIAGPLAVSALLLVPFAPYLSRNTARAGAVTVGFLLGGISLLGALNQTAFLVALLPLLLIGVPIFSVTYTYVADLRHGGRAVAVRERRQNLDVLLLAQGYSRVQVVGWLLAGSAYLCGLALLLVAMMEISFLVKTVVLVVGLVGGAAGFYVLLRLLPRRRVCGRANLIPPAADQRQSLQGEEVWLLGVRLHAVTYQGALETVREFLREGHPHMVVTSDASAVMRAQDDPEFREIVNEADLVTADGAGVVLASKLLDLPLQDKVSGCDLVADLCAIAAEEGRSVYFLGAAPGVAEEAAQRLQARIPALQVAGCHDGYFDETEE